MIATAHVAVCLQDAINGLIYSRDPAFYFSPAGNTGSPWQIAHLALYVTNVSDLVSLARGLMSMLPAESNR